ncbi:hypothetical protein FB99_46200 (plasmid) [Pantoea agglomerans]|nr:hypothetical protein FB99_46200 [Pantoea agglomerans]
MREKNHLFPYKHNGLFIAGVIISNSATHLKTDSTDSRIAQFYQGEKIPFGFRHSYIKRFIDR